MSCQQASRFHPATTAAATATLARNTATKRIATATAAALSTAVAATAAATLTPGESVAGKTTTEDSDPYAFTETVSVAPPILFNAQKSRARLSENNKSNGNSSNNNRRLAATAAGASNRKANLVAQLNATAAAVAAAAASTAKAQASLATTTAATATTNFNNVTQSQRQQPALSPSQLPLQAQASPKRATNVCIVRPQQQQQEKLAAEACQQPTTPPPPLYSHTPSLWQTPLILDTSQKHQPQPQQQHPYQQQQQQHHHQLQAVSIALVSPPTSPASLPSPTLTPTAAVTAMVAPIVSPKGGLPLPPSKFHHTTLAQHLQKVECLKKKKSLPLTCQNNNNNNYNNNSKQHNHMVESLNKTIGTATYNLTQPPPLTVFNTGTVQAAAHPPAAAPPQKQKHSTSTLDDSDLNEIPVNVIFRKPPVLMAGTGVGGVAAATAGQKQPNGVKLVLPLTPPTPPEVTTPPLLAHRLPQTAGGIPALAPSSKVSLPPAPSAVHAAGPLLVVSAAASQAMSLVHTPTPLTPPATPATTIKTEQMSSKVANANAAVNANAAPKRQTPGAAADGRKGNNKTNNAASVAKKNLASKPPEPKAISNPNPIADNAEPAVRQRRRKAASKRYSATINENELTDNATDSPYCVQQHWMHSTGRDVVLDTPLSPSNRREERIAVRKGMLRRQALQLLSTRSLQDLPVRAARQRLQCVQNMLVKYQDHAGQQQGIGIGNRCLVATCGLPTLTMAAHCERHIVNNSTQQLFQPCAAWRMDGTACLAPVFDVLHTLPLCTLHSHLRAGLEMVRPTAKLTAANLPLAGVPLAVSAPAVGMAGKRKRKANPNPVSRPQKRGRKPNAEQQMMSHQITTLPMMPSAVMQRKSSTTSLESIASNSQCSSANSHSQLSYSPPTATPAPVPVSAPQPLPGLSHLSIPPALAPLSGDYQPKPQQQQHQTPLFKFESDPQVQQLESGLNLLASANINIKAEEISQIVAQLAAAGGDLQPQNHLLNNNNNSLHFNNNNMSYTNNNNSFPSFNAAFGNAIGQPTHNGQHTTLALANTASLLGQDMFGICENSSAYASSEDTGLGGLSESELIGANDADDIALNGAHLLEEHDLVNVFDTLPDDAFNELFQSVQQAECEAMDRALEIADKNLKCLQQTIVGSEDNDLLNDFLDDMLADGVISSTNTSGIDAATLFVDSSSGGGNSSSNSANSSCTPASASVADIRGLVQT